MLSVANAGAADWPLSAWREEFYRLKRQILDIMVGVAMKTLSNYINHLAHTPLDDAFAAQAWEA